MMKTTFLNKVRLNNINETGKNKKVTRKEKLQKRFEKMSRNNGRKRK